MGTFRAKPVTIEAVQLTYPLISECLFDGKGLPMGVEFRGQVNPTERQYSNGQFICHSLNGEVLAAIDDWIIQEPGAPALCYPCKPDVFEAKYEAVEPVE